MAVNLARPDRSRLVVVVEDEPLILAVAGMALEDAGFDVLEAPNADAAVELLNREGPAAALFTDIDMPGSMNGLQLAELAGERWPDMKLVVTSGGAAPLARGFTGLIRSFLPKPYRCEDMVAVIGRSLAVH